MKRVTASSTLSVERFTELTFTECLAFLISLNEVFFTSATPCALTLHPAPTERRVMEKSAEDGLAVGLISFRLQDVLMPIGINVPRRNQVVTKGGYQV
jgi:hypothetical protein